MTSALRTSLSRLILIAAGTLLLTACGTSSAGNPPAWEAAYPKHVSRR